MSIEYTLNGYDYQSLETQGYANSYILYSDFFSDHSVIYIRLKFEDKDGNISYSPAKTINKKSTYSIYPNPFTDEINIKRITSGKIIIQSIEGHMVFENNIPDSGKINLAHLSKGFCILTIINKI